MINLNQINIDELKNFVDDPIEHINAFVETFESCIENAGPDSFIPMITYFNSDSNIILSITSIGYQDKDTMYKSFNEMLHFFSAGKAHSFIFAIDIRKTVYDQDNPNTKTSQPVDALSLSFVSEESSGILTLPYTVIDNKVQWFESEFDLSNMAEEDPKKKYQGEMVDLFYMMTHLEGPLFTPAQLLNYYNHKGYQFMIPDTTKVSSIKVFDNEH